MVKIGSITVGSSLLPYVKLSILMGFGPPKITSSSRGTDGKFLSGSVPSNASDLHRPDLMGKQFGMVRVISPTLIRRRHPHKKWDTQVVVTCTCTGCGVVKDIDYHNLMKGKTRGCQSCSRTIHPLYKTLRRRLQAALDRCANPENPSFHRYGGRGITFKFASVRDAVLYVLKNVVLPPKLTPDWHLDRKDNNKGYEPGNIRFVPRPDNALNQERNLGARVTFRGYLVPPSHALHLFRHFNPEIKYSDATLRNLIPVLTEEEIVRKWTTVHSEKPRGRYGTFSTPDPEIVSRFLEGLYTTA